MLEKLEALRASITEKAPYRAGVLDVDPEDLILFYGKSREARLATVFAFSLVGLILASPALSGKTHRLQ